MKDHSRRAVRINGSKPVNRLAHLMGEDGEGSVAVAEATLERIALEVPAIDDGSGNDGGDYEEDEDDDDDDDDDDGEHDLAFDEKIVIAGDPTSVLTEAKVCFIRHPKHPGKLIMVSLIEDILPEADDPDCDFDTTGTEMYQADLVVHLGKGFAEARKPLSPKSIDPVFFKKNNFRADVYEVPSADHGLDD